MKSLQDFITESLIVESTYSKQVKIVLKEFKSKFGWTLKEVNHGAEVRDKDHDIDDTLFWLFQPKELIAADKSDYFSIVIWEDGEISFDTGGASIDPINRVIDEIKTFYFSAGEIFANPREVKDNLELVIDAPYSDDEIDLEQQGWRLE